MIKWAKNNYKVQTTRIYNKLPVRQTVNMRIRPGSLLPSIGIERANIAHETVASVVVIVMVCSVLRVDITIHQNVTNCTLEILFE